MSQKVSLRLNVTFTNDYDRKYVETMLQRNLDKGAAELLRHIEPLEGLSYDAQIQESSTSEDYELDPLSTAGMGDDVDFDDTESLMAVADEAINELADMLEPLARLSSAEKKWGATVISALEYMSAAMNNLVAKRSNAFSIVGERPKVREARQSALEAHLERIAGVLAALWNCGDINNNSEFIVSTHAIEEHLKMEWWQINQIANQAVEIIEGDGDEPETV